ncbi:hypothetical protein A3F86_02280 [candidate division WOR-1 bacterium RIFCSPLOWO2_12_FULL_45_9]|uniref:Outer membrane protein beta-barrel domain-containing protein n=1 Tax=candidate division WOR-1 bacterium RIFCSPLOWO2_12_FULL_45_9 TaxID=1802568 RepID=A0A1F4RNF3_UNCSA|nr:MAG: hypothetical protein A3F86_02280 [candidate division WOR-1 bacterium RIFCSPLOWO2_12_FULL_45_9]
MLVGLLVSVGVWLALPVYALEGTATIGAQDLYNLSQRKTYRLGLRLSGISPASSLITSPYDFTVEFDAKLNENLDVGPRGGISGYQTGGVAVSAMKFGFGGRLYLTYWGEHGSTHGFFNAYVDAELDYYSAANISGIGAYGGVGLELAFGPNATGYGAIAYQTVSGTAPLDGIVVQLGTRLAFI